MSERPKLPRWFLPRAAPQGRRAGGRETQIPVPLDAARAATVDRLAGRLGLSRSDVLRLAVGRFAREGRAARAALKAVPAAPEGGPAYYKKAGNAPRARLLAVRFNADERDLLQRLSHGLRAARRDVCWMALDRLAAAVGDEAPAAG